MTISNAHLLLSLSRTWLQATDEFGFSKPLLSLTNSLLLHLEKQTPICSAFRALVKVAKNLAPVRCVEIITSVIFFLCVRETSLGYKFSSSLEKRYLFEIY